MGLKYKKVDQYDIEFLYDLFSERINYPKEIRFRKNEIPTFEQHKAFITSYLRSEDHPYKSWHIIIKNNIKVGALVLKKDGEWGYHVLMSHWGEKIGQSALNWLIKHNQDMDLIATIKPDNKVAIHIAKKFDHKLIGLVYLRKASH